MRTYYHRCMYHSRRDHAAAADIAAILAAPSYEEVQRANVARMQATFGPGYANRVELRAEAEAVFGVTPEPHGS
jgi:uncharacterized membrane protein